MYALLFLIVSVVVLAMLFQVNWILGLLFFLAVVVTLPAMVIQRRESQLGLETSTDAESHARGLLRLGNILGLDTTGIALAVILIIALCLVAKKIAYG